MASELFIILSLLHELINNLQLNQVSQNDCPTHANKTNSSPAMMKYHKFYQFRNILVLFFFFFSYNLIKNITNFTSWLISYKFSVNQPENHKLASFFSVFYFPFFKFYQFTSIFYRYIYQFTSMCLIKGSKQQPTDITQLSCIQHGYIEMISRPDTRFSNRNNESVGTAKSRLDHGIKPIQAPWLYQLCII